MKLIMENWKKYLLKEEAKGVPEMIADPGLIVKVVDASDGGKSIQLRWGKSLYGLVEIKATTGAKGKCKAKNQTGDTWEVTMAFVNPIKAKGWGPFLYDIAMEYVAGLGGRLMSDRKSVEDEAKNVWDFYLSRERGDVKPAQLDDLDGPFITPEDDTDDCMHYSFKDRYFSKGNRKLFFKTSKYDTKEFTDSSLTKSYVKTGGKTIIDQLTDLGKIKFVKGVKA